MKLSLQLELISFLTPLYDIIQYGPLLYLLPSEVRQLSSHGSDLSKWTQDVFPFFGVLTHVCDLSSFSEQTPDVFFSLWATIRVCQPVLQIQTKHC